MILLSSPLKNDHGKYYFFLEIEHNQNSQFKKFEKICRQLLSTMNILKLKISILSSNFEFTRGTLDVF